MGLADGVHSRSCFRSASHRCPEKVYTVQGVQKKLEIARDYAATHSESEQERYQKYHNLRSADKHFDIGEQVLILQPDTTASKLFSKWCGPATVVAIRSPYSYEVDLNGTVRH